MGFLPLHVMRGGGSEVIIENLYGNLLAHSYERSIHIYYILLIQAIRVTLDVPNAASEL